MFNIEGKETMLISVNPCQNPHGQLSCAILQAIYIIFCKHRQIPLPDSKFPLLRAHLRR